MNWKATPPAIETAAISIAALCLGGAVGFAVARIAPLGAGLAEAFGAGAIAALGAWLLVGRVDRRAGSPSISTALLAGGTMDEDVLLLDEMIEEEPLLLDDPLPYLTDDSRVVRLFAALPGVPGEAAPLAPGEMIARIEDFLGHSRAASFGEPPHRANEAASADASAALHTALADIRRSLRQAR